MRTGLNAPQSNASERVNVSILAGIKSFVKGLHQNWDTYLAEIASAQRNSKHTSKSHSPHFLLFGYHQINNAPTYKLLRDFDVVGELGQDVLPADVHLPIIHDQVRNHLLEAREKYDKHYDLRSGPINYVPDSLSDSSNKISKKLAPKFFPAIIRKRIGGVLYSVEDEKGRVLGIYHGIDIKL